MLLAREQNNDAQKENKYFSDFLHRIGISFISNLLKVFILTILQVGVNQFLFRLSVY